MNLTRFCNLIVACLAVALLVAACSSSLRAEFAIVQAQPVLNANAQKALQQQLHKAFEPILKAELSFACRVAKPKDEERRTLIASSVAWLDAFVAEFVTKQDQNDQQMWLQGVQRVVIGGPRESIDPHKSIQQGVAKMVAETLPAEKVAVYQSQAAKRAEFYRDAIVANLVVQLDEKLTLAPQQRKKISATLVERWDEKWPPQIESFAYASNSFLPSPQQAVRPELSAAQRNVFDQLNRSTQQMIVHAGGFGGQEMEVIDDVKLDEKPATADGPPVAEQPAVGNNVNRVTN
jgi:hypothetical protein